MRYRNIEFHIKVSFWKQTETAIDEETYSYRNLADLFEDCLTDRLPVKYYMNNGYMMQIWQEKKKLTN